MRHWLVKPTITCFRFCSWIVRLMTSNFIPWVNSRGIIDSIFMGSAYPMSLDHHVLVHSNNLGVRELYYFYPYWVLLNDQIFVSASTLDLHDGQPYYPFLHLLLQTMMQWFACLSHEYHAEVREISCVNHLKSPLDELTYMFWHSIILL